MNQPAGEAVKLDFCLLGFEHLASGFFYGRLHLSDVAVALENESQSLHVCVGYLGRGYVIVLAFVACALV